MYEDEKEVRVKALELAIERARGFLGDNAGKIVEDAKKFEEYILAKEVEKQ